MVTEQDDEDASTLQPQCGPSCTSEDCGKPAVKYCKDGCQFMCQQCHDDHQSIRITKKHQVIPASEGETFIKPKNQPYPPCNRHPHQLIDLYCRTCNIPICTTCNHANHKGHDCCELEEQANINKIKLEQIREDTDEIMHLLKQAVDKTKQQVKNAERDIDNACDSVKSTFRTLHDKLDKEEEKMMLNLQEARRTVQKIGDVTVDDQMMTLSRLESLKSCQTKLTDKDSNYDYVTVTDSIKRDVKNYNDQQLPGFMWSFQLVMTDRTGELCPSMRVEFTNSEEITEKKEVEEVMRFRLHNNQQPVEGLVVYKEHIYVVHLSSFVIYCFSNFGILSSKYKHGTGQKTEIQGMCLMMDREQAMLVVSDITNDEIVWIRINNDFTMRHDHTQHLNYVPMGSYNDRGVLLVCDEDNHCIHQYRGNSPPLREIKVPGNVRPWRVAPYDDRDQHNYMIVDYDNKQVVMIEKNGRVKKRYKRKISGIKLGKPYDAILDTDGYILISDESENHVLLLNKDTNEVRQLLKLEESQSLHLDADHNRLYVSGNGQDDNKCVFIYDYSQLGSGETNNELSPKIHLKVTL